MQQSELRMERDDAGGFKTELKGNIPIEVIIFHIKIWIEAQEVHAKKTYQQFYGDPT